MGEKQVKNKTISFFAIFVLAIFLSFYAYAQNRADITYNFSIAETSGNEIINDNPDYITSGEYVLKAPVCKGFGFDAWYSDSTYTTPVTTIKAQDGDIELFAKWYELTYDIAYVLTDESVPFSAEAVINNNPYIMYASETVYLTEPTTSYSGYSFDGWYFDKEYKIQATEISAFTCENITLYAKWKTISYSIRYDMGTVSQMAPGLSNPNPDKYIFGQGLELEPAISNHHAFTFEGWYTDEFFQNKIEAIDDTMSGDITIYANWNITTYPINYVLSTDGVGITNPNPSERDAIESVTLIPAENNNKSLMFDGWYTTPTFEKSSQITVISADVPGEITVYAKWIEANYAIKYDYGIISPIMYTVENPNPNGYKFGDEIELLPVEADGFIFNGWCSDANLKMPIEKISSTDFGNKTIYADFTEKTYTVNYVVENNGITYQQVSNTNPTVRTTTERIELEDARCVNVEYTFDGWYFDENFTQEAKAIRGYTAENVTVYAKWVRVVTYLPKWGDASLSNGVTAADARIILRYALGLETSFTDVQIRVSDINNDSKVTAVDARLALRLATGIEKEEDIIAKYSLPTIALKDGKVIFE